MDEPSQFKAKDVPNYKFFEPEVVPKRPTKCEEFRLTMMPPKQR